MCEVGWCYCFKFLEIELDFTQLRLLTTHIPNRKIYGVKFSSLIFQETNLPKTDENMKKDKNQVILLCVTWNKKLMKIEPCPYPGNQ